MTRQARLAVAGLYVSAARPQSQSFLSSSVAFQKDGAGPRRSPEPSVTHARVARTACHRPSGRDLVAQR